MLLTGKRILLGVTGGIAAYKAAFLTRLLIKEGAAVQVIMTTAALDFITPLTLATLSKRPVYHHFFQRDTGQWTNHVELGLWADLMLIAPCSAHTLSKLANGATDNLLTATYLSAKCPVMIAPAMDLDMYAHPAVQRNMDTLRSYGNILLEAASGELASGLSGPGRLMEPEDILRHIQNFFHTQTPSFLSGQKVLLTSGPTQEAIDPVRYISNHSSGKMGAALAEALLAKGAEVHAVIGKGAVLPRPHPRLQVYPVSSAAEMFAQAESLHLDMQGCIFTAAVADYAPVHVAAEKIKKQGAELQLTLTKTVDIAATLGAAKKEGQWHVGFALETENGPAHAEEKRLKKHFDLVVLNSPKEAGAAFQHDTNSVQFFSASGQRGSTGLAPKIEIAFRILEQLESVLQEQKSS